MNEVSRGFTKCSEFGGSCAVKKSCPTIYGSAKISGKLLSVDFCRLCIKLCIPSICSLSNVLMKPSNSAIDGTVGEGMLSLGDEGDLLNTGILESEKKDCVCTGLHAELATDESA